MWKKFLHIHEIRESGVYDVSFYSLFLYSNHCFKDCICLCIFEYTHTHVHMHTCMRIHTDTDFPDITILRKQQPACSLFNHLICKHQKTGLKTICLVITTASKLTLIARLYINCPSIETGKPTEKL